MHIASFGVNPGLHYAQTSVETTKLQLAQLISLQATHLPSVAVPTK
jgi:hypothetical protein